MDLRRSVRAALAIMLTGTTCGIIVLRAMGLASDLTDTLPAITGLNGTALAFYFKADKDEA